MNPINSSPNERTSLLGSPVSSSKRENTDKTIAAIFKESLTPIGQLGVQADLTKWHAISIKKPEGTVAKVISFVTSISLFQKIKNYFNGAGFKTDATLYTEVKRKNEEFLKNTMISIHLICGKIETAINDRIKAHEGDINQSENKITSFNEKVLPVLRLSAGPSRIKSAVDQLKATGEIKESSLSSLNDFDYKTILTNLCDNFLSEEEVNTFLDKSHMPTEETVIAGFNSLSDNKKETLIRIMSVLHAIGNNDLYKEVFKKATPDEKLVLFTPLVAMFKNASHPENSKNRATQAPKLTQALYNRLDSLKLMDLSGAGLPFSEMKQLTPYFNNPDYNNINIESKKIILRDPTGQSTYTYDSKSKNWSTEDKKHSLSHKQLIEKLDSHLNLSSFEAGNVTVGRPGRNQAGSAITITSPITGEKKVYTKNPEGNGWDGPSNKVSWKEMKEILVDHSIETGAINPAYKQRLELEKNACIENLREMIKNPQSPETLDQYNRLKQLEGIKDHSGFIYPQLPFLNEDQHNNIVASMLGLKKAQFIYQETSSLDQVNRLNEAIGSDSNFKWQQDGSIIKSNGLTAETFTYNRDSFNWESSGEPAKVLNHDEFCATIQLDNLMKKFDSLQTKAEINRSLGDIHRLCSLLDPADKNYVGNESNKPSGTFMTAMTEKFGLDRKAIKGLNRYGNITSARVESNVTLTSGKYINASHITSVGVIATQGPKANTLGDYFEMVFDNGGPAISVSNSNEKEKEKYHPYDQNEGTQIRAEGVSVGFMNFQNQAGTIKHTESIPIEFEGTPIGYKNTFEFRDGENKVLKYPEGHKWVGQEMRVEQFHYTKWADKDIPEDSGHVVDLVDQVIQAQKNGKEGATVVVHCSAGVGRTGTTIAIYDARVKLNNGEIPTSAVDSMLAQRKDRVNMVQTEEQLIMIHEVTESLKQESILRKQGVTSRDQIKELQEYLKSSDKISLREDGKIELDNKGIVKFYTYDKTEAKWMGSVVKDGFSIPLEENMNHKEFVLMLGNDAPPSVPPRNRFGADEADDGGPPPLIRKGQAVLSNTGIPKPQLKEIMVIINNKTIGVNYVGITLNDSGTITVHDDDDDVSFEYTYNQGNQQWTNGTSKEFHTHDEFIKILKLQSDTDYIPPPSLGTTPGA